MRELLNSRLRGGEKQFIALTKLGTIWTDNKNKLKIIFKKASLKLVINFLLYNCFINFDNSSFWQFIGMPMGPSLLWIICFYITTRIVTIH